MEKLRGFMGLIRYYQKFVYNYAKIASSMTSFLAKEKLISTNMIQEDFKQFK